MSPKSASYIFWLPCDAEIARWSAAVPPAAINGAAAAGAIFNYPHRSEGCLPQSITWGSLVRGKVGYCGMSPLGKMRYLRFKRQGFCIVMHYHGGAGFSMLDDQAKKVQPAASSTMLYLMADAVATCVLLRHSVNTLVQAPVAAPVFLQPHVHKPSHHRNENKSWEDNVSPRWVSTAPLGGILYHALASLPPSSRP